MSLRRRLGDDMLTRAEFSKPPWPSGCNADPSGKAPMFNPSCGFYNHLFSRMMPYCGVAGGATVNGSIPHVSKISQGGAAKCGPPARARCQLSWSVFRASASQLSSDGRESFTHTH